MTTGYQPTWPETTIFWGAGATAALGFPVTAQQGTLLRKLETKEDGAPKVLELEKIFHRSTCAQLKLLLNILKDNGEQQIAAISDEQRRAIQERLPEADRNTIDDLIINLRSDYDWDALKKMMRLLPQENDSASFLRDLFNLLDMHLFSNLSFTVTDEQGQRETLSQVRLRGARNCLVMLINLFFQGAYLKLVLEHPEKLEPYRAFSQALADLMHEEAIAFRHMDTRDRKFYLFSYAVVSMNFDPLLLWLLFNVHRDVNESGNAPYVAQPAAQVRLYHDFGHFLGCRKVDADTLMPWYPFNEPAVQRVNDPEHIKKRVARVGKFYLPHGCSTWRECPSCGKLNMHLGDEWGLKSTTLFPPSLLQRDHLCKPLSPEVERKRDKGWVDSLQCLYCGAITNALHTPMIMQSSFKGKHASFLEEIQRDMRACIEGTRHFVLMGYSLPEDDVIYRALLASRRKTNTYCSVVVGHKGPPTWLYGDDLENHCRSHPGSVDHGVPTIRAAIEIFEKDNVRALTGGIPAVFGSAVETRGIVREMLYPTHQSSLQKRTR